VNFPPSGFLSHVGTIRNPNDWESDKLPAEVNVKVHRSEFKGGKHIKYLFTEFGVANYPAYRAGVLGVEDDDGVMLLLVLPTSKTHCLVQLVRRRKADNPCGLPAQMRHN
jgi:hypothetical protein